jgi:hypothetical protein
MQTKSMLLREEPETFEGYAFAVADKNHEPGTYPARDSV